MKYTETYPDAIFSRHIESYWQIEKEVSHSDLPLELLLPTCTFNIIFTDQPYWIKSRSHSFWTLIKPGVSFIGQNSGCLIIKSDTPINIIGARFKPFAFANILNVPAIQLSESVVPLSKVIDCQLGNSFDIDHIFTEPFAEVRYQYLNEIMHTFLSSSMLVDETLRAQLNYIMDRHGNIKVNELLEKFQVSKVTLSKHFINKVGLKPKKVCQIWRMNRVLQLKDTLPKLNLTELSLKVGFYDQAHFIKDFKSMLGLSPKRFFTQNSDLVQVANLNISKRFSNQYDPRVV